MVRWFTRRRSLRGSDAQFAKPIESLEGRRLLAASISGIAFDDVDGNSLKGGSEGVLADRTVWLDYDNDGVIDSGTATVASTDVPKALPDQTTTTSILPVSGLAGAITDLDVTLDITHTYDADLRVTLIAPGGQRVELFNTVGSRSDNFTGTILDDEAATAITAGSAPFTGRYRPTGSLAALDGSVANGTWTLEVTDEFEFDTGTLNSWSITVATAEPTRVTDAAGAYSFTVPAPATYNVRQVIPTGWVGTAPAGGVHSVSAVDAQAYAARDFGSRIIDTTPPTATLTEALNVTTSGGTNYFFKVTYADNIGVDFNSIVAGNDVEVTGPGAYSRLSTLASLTQAAGVWTATYYVQAPGGTWDSADSGTYTIALRTSEVSDTSGNFAPAGVLGTFTAALADTTPPTATLTEAINVTTSGGTNYFFKVTYGDNAEVDFNSIVAGNDVQVAGPGGYSRLSALANLTTAGGQWTATYYVSTPGGSWGPEDGGTYTISMRAAEVSDVNGNFVPAAALGTFAATIADTTPPTATLTDAPNVTIPGGTRYFFKVTYADNVGVDFNSIVAGNDVQVTGPGGFSALSTLANLTTAAGQWTATYYVNALGGAWDGSDGGLYTISLRSTEVSDTSNNFTVAQTLGTFNVTLADSTPPTAVLTEAPNVTGPGGSTYFFKVVYADNVGVDFNSIVAGSDVQVTGPGAFSALSTLASLTTASGQWTATYYITVPGGSWDPSDNGTYTVSLRAGEVSDTSANFAAAASLGTFNVNLSDPDAPTATLVEAPNVTAAGAVNYFFKVTYVDNVGVDFNSIIAGNDVLVTGLGGYSQLSTLASLTTSAGQWTATYYVLTPGGTWDATDNGTYSIAMRATEVSDVSGNFVAAGLLGTFEVAIPA